MENRPVFPSVLKLQTLEIDEDNQNGCIISGTRNNLHYTMINVYEDEIYPNKLTAIPRMHVKVGMHELAGALTNKWTENMVMAYKCDKKYCVNPYHLERVTARVNNSDHVLKEKQPAREAEVLALAKIGLTHTWKLRGEDNDLYCQPVV